jgi:phosphatidylglycerophosphate synthase
MTSNERWALVNAAVLLVATAGTAWFRILDPLLVAGLVMLGALVVTGQGRWTPQGDFGLANGVTAVRIGLLGFLPLAAAAGAAYLIVLSVLILVLDGLDGWLARRYALSSEFGAFFDKETDALFLLLLCGGAAFQGPLPVWILGAGLLRYGFVLVLFFLPVPETTESRSTMARYVYGCMIGALLASFLPYPLLYRPLVTVATAALLFSFVRSLWGVLPSRQALWRW